jgi:dihydroneopterin aldolase
MDKVFLKQMSFYGYHGVFPEENRLGQRFLVDVEMVADLQEAGQTDDLRKTIDYSKIYEMVKTEVEGKPYRLLETLAERIAQRILSHELVQEVRVRVTKPEPPIPGHLAAVGVEINRRKR